ncbi:MAG: hypothetical protein MUF33_00460 [Candidatus Nanopelagicales bacterium]|jgi:hypothetical protein|nr:hypothetical protein [Candidatus Nanopelagicales bacterium]MCU0296971.1 hypothetical protein [Candidatus Nanopelagicales bacterium]
MALAREFLELMPLTIQVRKRTAVNKYNEPTLGSPVEYRARLEPINRRLRSLEGEERIVSARLIVDAQGELRDTDVVTLPDGTTPTVVAVTTEYDEFGVHHQTYQLEG